MRTPKTILVTGSSSGFGKLAVSLLLERGHTVVAAMRGGEGRLSGIFGAEGKRHAGRLIGVDLHMERPETFAAARGLVEERFGGRLDVLVNNAGYGLFGSLEDFTEAQLRHQYDVNVFGPLLLTRELLPSLRAARGRILNVSSVVGRVTAPYYGAYASTKFALEAFTESLRYEEAPHGVQVGLIEPGGFATEFSGKSKFLAEGASDPASRHGAPTLALDRVFRETRGRLGNPIRVARLIVRLCERKRVPVRSLIGVDAWAMVLFARLVPDSWRVAIEGRFARFLIARGARRD